MRNILLTLHILLAILVIGWLAMQSMVVPGMIRRGNAGYVRGAATVAKKVGPMSGLVFLVGIALVLRNRTAFSFGDTWISLSMLFFIVTAVLGAVFIGRAEERAADKLEAGETAVDEARTISILGGISSLLLVTIVYLMVAKPG